jgi:hypothetical protein
MTQCITCGLLQPSFLSYGLSDSPLVGVRALEHTVSIGGSA